MRGRVVEDDQMTGLTNLLRRSLCMSRKVANAEHLLTG